MNKKEFLKYADLLWEKGEMELDMVAQRIEALCAGDIEKAEFIEKMMLEPISNQIKYLAKKLSN